MEEANEFHGITPEQAEAIQAAFAAVAKAAEEACRILIQFWELAKKVLRQIAPEGMRVYRLKARRTGKRRHWMYYGLWRHLYRALRGPSLPAPGEHS